MSSSLPNIAGSLSPLLNALPSDDNDNALLNSMTRLSINIASATPLPSSPRVGSPHRRPDQRKAAPSPRQKSAHSPLRRSPSALSLDTPTSPAPSLLRKASMNSLHGIGGGTPPRASSSRRSSSAQIINGMGSSIVGKSPLSHLDDSSEQKPSITAESIASTHFKSEIDLLASNEDERPAETIVILHDSCYGHRYSRPRTSKAGLSTIVERPERIHASILGISVAYVRLGGRHSEGCYAPHPKKNASNIPNVPFKIRKTTRKLALSSPAVTNVHGTKWMEELKIMCDGAEAKLALNGKELVRPHMNRGSDGSPPQFHEGDLYLCAESLDAMEGALGAVCEGVDAVFNGAVLGIGPKRAFVAIRPPGHHCSASYPSGFCWLNNVHVGIAHAALNHGLTHAAIIDFDLHHGDGSQGIAWEHNARAQSVPKNAPAWKKTSIGYFSLHDINSYPCEIGDEEKVKNASICIENAHGQNIWNVHLQPWRSEAEFWALYESRYTVLLEKSRVFLRGQTDRIRCSASNLKPKAAIFLSAGFDASEWESSGMQRHKVNVPTEFYARITRDVIKIAAEEGCSVDGRIISVLEGGYSDRALSSGVLSHISGLAGGDPDLVKQELNPTGLGYEIAQRTGALNLNSHNDTPKSGPAYDPSWWALPQLEILDRTVNPAPIPAESKKVRDATPTYFSSTQSFSAKIVDSPKSRRTSGVNGNGASPKPITRPPSPPPPEVTWATAAHELSKILIPTDRQTMSCKPEDLSAEATRARRDRQSILTPPAPSNGPILGTAPATRMSLRERKAAKPLSTTDEENERDKAVLKASRRKTVADSAVLAAEKNGSRGPAQKAEPGYKQPTKQSSRRLSLASNTGSVMTEAPSVLLSNSSSRAPSQAPTTLSNRPGSSQSIRPDSSMSTRGHSIPPIAVKKTRAANPSRSDAAKPARGATRTTATRNSSQKVNEAPTTKRASSSSRSTNGVAASNSAASTTSTSDIDSLTSGMKKIKINLTTKAQREAKAAQALKIATSAPKNTTDGNPLPISASGGSMHAPANPQPQEKSSSHPATLVPKSERPLATPEPLTPQPSVFARIQQLQVASSVPLPASPPRASTTTTIASPRTELNNIFITYQPEGPPPTAAPRQEALKWLEPNTSTPARSPSKRTVADLPVFSATGVIPFGVNSEGSKEDTKIEPSIWDVPETPGR